MKRSPGRPLEPIPRERLLQLATGAFARSGYAGTSLEQIASLAGITKAALFHHFESKEALYLEVLGNLVGYLRSLIVHMVQEEGAFLDRLDRLGSVITHFLGPRPEAAQLLVREMMDDGPFLRSGGLEAVMAALEATSLFLESGMRAGDIPWQDPRQLALSIAGVHLHFFATIRISSLLLNADFSDEEDLQAREAVLLRQVRGMCGASP